MANRRTTRMIMKRKLEQCNTHLEAVLNYVAEVGLVYQEALPEVSEILANVYQGLEIAQEAIKKSNEKI